MIYLHNICSNVVNAYQQSFHAGMGWSTRCTIYHGVDFTKRSIKTSLRPYKIIKTEPKCTA